MSMKNDIDQGVSLQYLFEERFRLSGDKCAIVFKNKEISFNELNLRANRLANLLVDKQVKEGDIVVILLERSEDILVSILAVLKVGAAYLPVDLNYPSSRVEHMLNDSMCRLVIADDSGTKMLGAIQSELPWTSHWWRILWHSIHGLNVTKAQQPIWRTSFTRQVRLENPKACVSLMAMWLILMQGCKNALI